VSTFREINEAQLAQLATMTTVEEVLALCAPVAGVSVGDGFWIGDGDELLGALYDAGWRSVDYRAPYHWCLKAPDGSLLTYVEGDLYRSNSMPRKG
jgi:hypothetical protein